MNIVRFGDVASRLNIHVDQETTTLEYYVGGEHIDSCDLLIHKKAPIKGSTIGYQFQFGFEKRDILFMTKNPHLRKASMVDFNGLCSIATFVIRSNDESVLLQDYLLLEMQSDRFWNYCEEHKSGGVNYFINWGTLSNYEFPLPSLNEQKERSEKLWAAYNVKQSYLKMIDATEEMVKSQFIEMFYNRGITPQKLGTHISVIRGVSYKPTDLRDKVSDNCTLVLRSNNIENGTINYNDVVYVDSARVSQTQLVNTGDIVMCGSNGSKSLVGKAAMINDTPPHQSSFGTFCLGIRCKESLNPKFLSTYFQTSIYRKEIESLGSGSNILNIRPDHINNLSIPIPEIFEQNSFVSIVEQADKSEFELRKSIDAIDAVIKSLINSL